MTAYILLIVVLTNLIHDLTSVTIIPYTLTSRTHTSTAIKFLVNHDQFILTYILYVDTSCNKKSQTCISHLHVHCNEAIRESVSKLDLTSHTYMCIAIKNVKKKTENGYLLHLTYTCVLRSQTYTIIKMCTRISCVQFPQNLYRFCYLIECRTLL